MSIISTSKDSNYFYININANKPITAIKYDFGVRDSYYFNRSGKEIFVKNKDDKNFKIDLSSLNYGTYTIIIYFEDNTFNLSNFDISFIKNINTNETSILFTDYTPFDKYKIINSISKFAPLISRTDDDKNIENLFSIANHIRKNDIYKYIINIYRINDISYNNNIVNINISTNILNPYYLYGLIILNPSSNPIILIRFSEKILVEKDTINIDVKFPLI